ncbi:helix-turn-helix domain-containing protein [Pararhodobacter sp. CCB-MM2]|uniref:helix-turn-helix domain-containing protein n=1 Tax=Pararhodobacter sp. CCB-MM2 TaxID=1786003 RepID=UPI0009F2D123|nr:helix-turn-helix domain-containing protein [Pararhodobacter sp. CCB-MM2]
MSIRMMTEVWANGPSNQSELLVLLALADFADDDGFCWPSMASIATKARIEERSARRVIRRLEDAGWLSVKVGNGRRGCSEYRVKPGPKVPRTECPPDTERTKPGPSVQETRTPRSPEPSGTIKNRQEESAGEDPPRRKPLRQLPEDWTPSDRNIADATKHQFTDEEIRHEAHRFRNYHQSHDTRFRDWDAAWRTWLGNARKFARRAPRADAEARIIAVAAATPRSPNPSWH